jgi:hypothetical protein
VVRPDSVQYAGAAEKRRRASPQSPGSATHTSSTIQPAFRRSLSPSTRWSKARCAGTVLPSAWNRTGAFAAASAGDTKTPADTEVPTGDEFPESG